MARRALTSTLNHGFVNPREERLQAEVRGALAALAYYQVLMTVRALDPRLVLIERQVAAHRHVVVSLALRPRATALVRRVLLGHALLAEPLVARTIARHADRACTHVA